MALLSAKRSKDPNTKVGSCIVTEDNKVVGIGYNGFPRGCKDCDLPWERTGEWINTKYPYVVHAEQNAILNSTGSLKGCKLYVTLFPCNECCKLILQSGIKEVVFLNENNRPEYIASLTASKKMMDMAGVSYRQYCSQEKILLEL